MTKHEAMLHGLETVKDLSKDAWGDVRDIYLPKRLLHRLSHDFQIRWLAVIDALEPRMLKGVTTARSTAEELVMWAAALEGAPLVGSSDAAGLVEDYVQDFDILWLFDPKFDGVEDDDDFMNDLGAANLHPNDWFTPFGEKATA